jgi:hypothetical protein
MEKCILFEKDFLNSTIIGERKGLTGKVSKVLRLGL